MSIATLIPLILIVGVMFMMTRSAKNKQRQQQSMRNTMTPGAGVRTIGGLYGRVVEVHDESVQLEIDEDVQVHFAKNAIAAVLDTAEYERIVNRVEPAAEDDAAVEAEDADDTAAVDETAEAEAVESVEEPEDVKDAAEGEGKKDPESVSK